MRERLEDILGQNLPTSRLGATQLDRLQRLTESFNGVTCWNGVGGVSEPATAVVVTEAAHAPRIEMLVSSLHENSIVIIPCGENPAFDLLKSKLYAHGSLGANAAEAPHHVWWGGVKPPSVRTGVYRKEETLFISSFRRTIPGPSHADRLVKDMNRLGLNHFVADLSQEIEMYGYAVTKVDFIIEKWASTGQPVFWIDPQARLKGYPLLPQSSGCDFAVHRRSNGAMTTGALFFNQTESARALLDMWQRLTLSHPDLPESFLLDQAWTLATSQQQIETTWLPDTYWQTGGVKALDGTIIVGKSGSGSDDQLLEAFSVPLQGARRFGRHQAPEAHLVMKGAADAQRPVTVVMCNVLASAARDVGEAVEAAASAFAADPGGFSLMEIVLCGWDEDINSVLQLEFHSWILMTDPSERLQADAFRSLSQSGVGAGRWGPVTESTINRKPMNSRRTLPWLP